MKKNRAIPALLIAGIMLLGGCTGNGAATTTTPPPTTPTETAAAQTNAPTTATTAPTETPATKEPVVMGEPFITYMSQDYGTLNYFNSNKSVDSEEGFSHFIDPLIQHDKYARLSPDIAIDWSCSADGLTWTLHLRQDAKWFKSDGSEYAPVTAHDFVAGAMMVLNPAVGSVTADFMLDFVAGAEEYYADNSIGFDKVGVKAIDDYTLEYTNIGPTPFFPSLLTYTTYLPVCQKFVDEIGGIQNFGLNKDSILYSGSFILESWEKDVGRKLVKNENYFDADRVHVPYIQFFSIPDGTVAFELFKRGEISAAAVLTAQLEEAMADPVYKDQLFETLTTSASWYYGFNSVSPNKDWNTAVLNENFRFALQHAFNRQPMLMIYNPINQTNIASGLYSAANISVTPEGKDYVTFGRLPELNEKNRNSYDVALAQQYMAKAVEELGSTVTWPIEMRVLGTSSETSERLNAIIRQSFETAFPNEIKVSTKIYTSDTYYKIMDEGDYEFTSSGWSADYADPSAYLDTVVPGHDVDRFGFINFPEMAEYTRLVNEAKSITDDMNKRYEKFAEAEAILYDHCIIITYRYNGGNYAINKIQNPYDVLRGGFGLAPAKFLDRIYGTDPISITEREEQRVKYEAERAALSH